MSMSHILKSILTKREQFAAPTNYHGWSMPLNPGLFAVTKKNNFESYLVLLWFCWLSFPFVWHYIVIVRADSSSLLQLVLQQIKTNSKVMITITYNQPEDLSVSQYHHNEMDAFGNESNHVSPYVTGWNQLVLHVHIPRPKTSSGFLTTQTLHTYFSPKWLC